ncbi:hypothetical protein Y032_0149g2695 [Ancylostoma ceylanicum]|uniref:Uncharacterized protein n=1 Tax=Ancylostoma ceylanicum TaxID=53326 RepID=A0A016T1W6_9BILA|nr:hypothetical protein Y032_0149g2695 [Ancylostoma ceylanicum]
MAHMRSTTAEHPEDLVRGPGLLFSASQIPVPSFARIEMGVFKQNLSLPPSLGDFELTLRSFTIAPRLLPSPVLCLCSIRAHNRGSSAITSGGSVADCNLPRPDRNVEYLIIIGL